MNEENLRVIEAYANEKLSKSLALEAHHRLLGSPDGEAYRQTLHCKFMSEVDNVTPDLALRAMYRAKLQNQ